MDDIYDFVAETIDGRSAPLADYRGKVLLIVNTASQCGFTPQYAGLEALHRKYGDRGLVMLGFPCNQFGAQEPGDAAAIQDFCSTTYGVNFQLMRKIEVNGPRAHPLYVWLKAQKRGVLGTGSIKWNFTKFLVNRSGQVADRYAPNVAPKALESAIEALL
jgi:glutathione peroxidase